MVQLMPRSHIVSQRLTGRLSIKLVTSFFRRRRSFALLVEVERRIAVSRYPGHVEGEYLERHWRELDLDDLNGNTLRLDIGSAALVQREAVQ
jgi:hypothetical protein